MVTVAPLAAAGALGASALAITLLAPDLLEEARSGVASRRRAVTINGKAPGSARDTSQKRFSLRAGSKSIRRTSNWGSAAEVLTCER